MALHSEQVTYQPLCPHWQFAVGEDTRRSCGAARQNTHIQTYEGKTEEAAAGLNISFGKATDFKQKHRFVVLKAKKNALKQSLTYQVPQIKNQAGLEILTEKLA